MSDIKFPSEVPSLATVTDETVLLSSKDGLINKVTVGDIVTPINNRIDGLELGVLGSITTTQTLPQLNALADGIYEAQTAGLYANGLTAKVGFYTRFKKTGTTWTISSETEMPTTPVADTIIEGGVIATSQDAVFKESKAIKEGGVQIELTTTNAYINKTTGAVVSNVGWILSQMIDASSDDVFNRKGNAIAQSSSGAEVYAFNSSGTYLGFYTKSETEYNFKISEVLPAGTTKIRLASSASSGLVVKKMSQIKATAVEKLEKIDDLNNLIIEINAFNEGYAGYQDVNGNIVPGGTSWKVTKPIYVENVDEVEYTGVTQSAVYPLIGFDENMVKVASLLAQGSHVGVKVEIPANVIYIIACARTQVGDVQILKYTGFNNAVLGQTNYVTNDFFIPSKVWAKQGESISLNINGIVNKHPKDYSRDTFFNAPLGNEDFIKLSPVSDISIPVVQRLLDNNLTTLGNINLKTTGAVTSPTTPQYFIFLGDSTVKGVANAGIEGAIPNEVSRRLTGIGTNINPLNAPTSLSLTNINFIGTIGDQPIKHEGRGGWSFANYLTTASGNAFWNPATLKFDLVYYLTQNNFTGVDSTGSNLTILIQLGWNDVFNFTLSQIEANCKQLLDLMKAQKSSIRVKLISMQLPPTDVYKSYTGTRQQSYVSTMKKVMLIAELYEKIANDPTYSFWVEHISYMSTFFPDNSYPTTNIKVNSRDAIETTVNTDDVHPNAYGYAQMADTVFYNILYNYCRV